MRWHTGGLALGFVALTLAIHLASRRSAPSYELSMYGSTPTAAWLLGGVALLAALVVAVRATDRLRYGLALTLGLSTVFCVAALPVLRGYYFYGAGDALTHLGWVRDISTGVFDPLELLYPGVHLTSILVSRLLAVSLERALSLTVISFFAAFLVFVPLAVRTVTTRPRATAVGAFSAALLLPINNVATHASTHPSSQAILFVPLLVFLVLRYVTEPQQDSRFRFRFRFRGKSRFRVGVSPSATGVLLALGTTALVFLHPQQALGFVVVLGCLSGYQAFVRWRGRHDAIGAHRPVYVQTAFATLVYLAWAPQHDRIRLAVVNLVSGLFESGAAAPEVSQKAVSLTQVGGSLPELFAKLFLVATVYSALTGLLALAVVTGRGALSRHGDALVRYLLVALVPLFGLFGLFFFASAGDHYFRTLGYIMVFVTILGAVALTVGLDALDGRVDADAASVVLVVFFVALTPLAVVGVHASPFIYQPNGQVSAAEYDGYETAFATRDTDVAFTGIRHGPERYVDAIYGTTTPAATTFPGASSAVPPPVFASNLSTYYDERRYLPVARSDVEREVTLYHGFRYSRRGFQRLDATPTVDRVESNGEFRLYLLGNRSVS